METEALDINTDEETTLLPVPRSRQDRVVYALIVTILPILCFYFSSWMTPQWQAITSSDEFSDYVKILLLPQIAWVFFPFFVYSAICLILLLIAPQGFSSRFVVRFGIYTGVLIGFQYTISILILYPVISLVSAAFLIASKYIYTRARGRRDFGFLAISVPILLMITVVIFSTFAISSLGLYPVLIFIAVLAFFIVALAADGLRFFFTSIFRWVQEHRKLAFLSLLFFVLLIVASITVPILQPMIQLGSSWLYLPLLLLLVAFLTAAPILYLAVMFVTAVKLSKAETALAFLPHWQAPAWAILIVSSYGVAWRFAILQAIQYYQSLPPAPPPSDCYIATASARGHQPFVRSKLVRTIKGDLWVTHQLQVFKCAEIALMTLLPRFHTALRRIYNRIGPTLAGKLGNPFLADMAYLILKPLEWLAFAGLKILIPEIDKYVQRFYI